jgi:DNA-binding winged helix-turn-helix (wHTH) protein/Tol biopolymer transport system component
LPQGPSATGQPGPDFYEFGVFRLEVSSRSLYRAGEFVPLTPKVLEILLVLVEEAGKVVTKDELMQRVWPDAFVEEGSIANNISILRKTLNLDFPGEGPIATVSRRGYRFTAEVSLRSATAEITLRAPASSATPAPAPTIDDAPAATTIRDALRLPAPILGAKHNRVLVAGAALLVFVLVGLVTGFVLLERGRVYPFQHVTMERLTHSGDVYTAAISPDGRFIVTELRDNGKYGLWLRNTATGSITPVVPSSDLEIFDLTFSRDGNFIYFRRNVDLTTELRSLFRVPVLGGTPVEIVRNIDTNPAFSPDEKRMAYLVWNTEPGKYQVVVADADGTNPRVMFTGLLPAPDDPAWASSSDGDVVVVCVRVRDGVQGELAALDVNTGSMRIFYTGNSVMRTPEWLPGGKGLLVRYGGTEGSHWQIGYVSYPAGKFHPVTTDTNSYSSGISITADGAAFVTTQRDVTYNVYVTPLDSEQASPGRAILSAQHLVGIAWTRQGTLLAGADGRLVRLAPQGGEPEVLVSEPAFRVHTPAQCGEERIVFRGAYADRGAGIWRSGRNGADRQQVTSGTFDWDPVCSPDGEWLVFADRSQKNSVKRLALGGGSAGGTASATSVTTVVDALAFADSFDLSPNGHWLVADVIQLALTNPEPEEIDVWRVVDMTTGKAVRDIRPVPRGARFPRFTPDSKAFVYVLYEQGVERLFLQPLDGSAGHVMATFRNAGRLEDFRFSPDGKSIAVIRQHNSQDVVLIRQVND